MTEYDYSPQGLARYSAQQNRVSNWVVTTEEHRNDFGNALMVTRSAASLSTSRTANNVEEPTSHRTSTAVPSPPDPSTSSVIVSDPNAPQVLGSIPNGTSHAGTEKSRSSHHTSHQSSFHSSGYHRSASHHHSSRSRKKTGKSSMYIMNIPPPSSTSSSGLVVISSRKKVSAMYVPPWPANPQAAVTQPTSQYLSYVSPSQVYVPLVYPTASQSSIPSSSYNYRQPAQANQHYPSTACSTTHPSAAPVAIPRQPTNIQVQVPASYTYSQSSQIHFPGISVVGSGNERGSKTKRKNKAGERSSITRRS